jgi:inorganic triphosphatase YgiF
MKAGMEREPGLRLELTQIELQRLRTHPALADLSAGEPVTQTRHSICFDTADHKLRGAGIALLLRSDGAGWRQTVTAADAAGSRRAGRPIAAATVPRPRPDVAAIGDRRLRRKVEKAVDRATLAPVFETLVERTTRQLRSGVGELELALDEGVVRAGDAQEGVCGAELELKWGAPDCLLQTATRLFGSTALRLADGSTLERGYRLAIRPTAVRAPPRRAEPVPLASGDTCAEALARIVESATAQIVANRTAVLDSEDPDAAHQLRIGLRRLRSALRAFRPVAETPVLRELDGHARALAGSVGGLRDADVLIDDIFAPAVAALNGDAGAARLREALLANRARARERARADLCGEQWSVLQLHLALWPRTIEGLEQLAAPVTKLARSALKRQWRKVVASGRRLDDLTVEQRHAMRKDLKSLRYAAEFFATLFPAQAARGFIKEVRALQEAFGYLNDVAAAERLVAICEAHCGADLDARLIAGFVLGWHNAEAARAWKEVHKGWRRLAKGPRFWA